MNGYNCAPKKLCLQERGTKPDLDSGSQFAKLDLSVTIGNLQKQLSKIT